VEIHSKKVSEIYLADISGKLMTKHLLNGGKRLKLRLDNFPAGVYFVKYELDGEWLNEKVILVR
jgi:hypothetical protein